ncbi:MULTISPECIES: Lrp/AsnC family transcriptional regulator [Hydrogenovibrio]|jgi:Transcriptional regulators|uniref:Lrp/AsnC family transcriptional regulator n=1 Tax=Hydrogenovibrio TaxID=28884 RepID=UPI000B01E834|nr:MULTISPECIES: Lrp/AsnC family transcriptional regulator [Hydrogenovibrio]MPQ76695.1 Lrp/AsnC family transcriptional regulator [Hydrogenovibrio sp. JE_KL2]BBN60407.1 AsnC family transcriptional regulator [Hydrogenovibrio marinus]
MLQLDKFDKAILSALQENGRLSNQELADQIGLSPSACLRRFKALETSGLIVGYRALLDAKKLGLDLMALVHISVDKHTKERFQGFESAVQAIPNVLECLLLTGQSADYQLKVVVKDMDAYQDLLLNHLTQIDGVSGVHTSFVLRKVVDKTALPIG